ncbi:MAG: hypothetical protein MRJ68_05565 [Nitrospira sp.]|nr:hypothetical protein [Nitrospira sp.]
MLMWDKPEIIEGLTTYGDDKDWRVTYVFPHAPRFRIDDNGLPVFKFLKYRFPIDRPDGKKGGGFLICDVEFVVDESKWLAVKDVLQERINRKWRDERREGSPPEAKLGQLSYLRGAASVTFLDSGGTLVEKIRNPGSPSLYGKMITPITIEMSPEGATLAEQALQDKGGVLQVAYDLWTPVKLPPLKVHGWFRASQFMEFHQKIDVEERFWREDDYHEQITQSLFEHEALGIDIDPGTVTDQKVLSAVRDWAQQNVQDAATRMILGEPPSQDPEAMRKLYTEKDFENISLDVMSTKIKDYNLWSKENQVMEWNPAPRGTLPNITSMTGKDGKPFKWADFAKTVDLNDPFFRQLTVTTRANADFAALPLDSIEVKLEYKQGSEHAVQEYSLRKPDDVGKFATFIANDNYKYKYSYQVNYKNQSRRYESPVMETDERMLTVNVGDTGILLVDVAPGDLNFNQVKEVQVTLQYEDRAHDVDLVEQVFRMDKDHTVHQWVRVIFAPRNQPYRYQVKYFMADGKEYVSAWKTSHSQKLFINDPFSATRTVSIRGFGDFDKRIDSIFVDLRYRDEDNSYAQTKSVALSKANTFEDWLFPVITDGGGKVTYSANIRFKDGTVQEIPEAEATKDTIMLGDVMLEQPISVMPDLIDFNRVKMAKVTLHYKDEEKGIDETGDLVFKKDTTQTLVWIFPYKNKNKLSYDWSASYFMADNSVKKTGPTSTTEKTLVLPEVLN